MTEQVWRAHEFRKIQPQNILFFIDLLTVENERFMRRLWVNLSNCGSTITIIIIVKLWVKNSVMRPRMGVILDINEKENVTEKPDRIERSLLDVWKTKENEFMLWTVSNTQFQFVCEKLLPLLFQVYKCAYLCGFRRCDFLNEKMPMVDGLKRCGWHSRTVVLTIYPFFYIQGQLHMGLFEHTFSWLAQNSNKISSWTYQSAI